MNTQVKVYVLTALLTAGAAVPAMAAENQGNCSSAGAIKTNAMGAVDEKQLQSHIEQVEADLQQRQFRHARGPRLSSTRDLKQHLADMQVALQTLIDKKYLAGCTEVKNQASIEARVALQEQEQGGK